MMLSIPLISRYRVSHGYGVHSPFAYRFIINVLRERLPYYAYSAIDALGGAMPARQAKLLFRLVNHFEPATVSLSGPLAGEALQMARMARSSVSVTDTPALAHMVIAAGLTDGDPLPDCPEPPAVVVMLMCSDHCRREAQRRWARGISFSNGRTDVLVNLHGLPRLHYRLRF